MEENILYIIVTPIQTSSPSRLQRRRLVASKRTYDLNPSGLLPVLGSTASTQHSLCWSESVLKWKISSYPSVFYILNTFHPSDHPQLACWTTDLIGAHCQAASLYKYSCRDCRNARRVSSARFFVVVSRNCAYPPSLLPPLSYRCHSLKGPKDEGPKRTMTTGSTQNRNNTHWHGS